MSFKNLILALTFMAIFAMGLRFSVDTDTWWQLRTGELIAQERAIPKTDSFSFTREGETWRYPSTAWLMELTLFGIYNWFGTGGLNLWLAVTITVAFGFIYMAMSGGGFLRAFVLILAATVSGVYWAARPYMATFVLSAVFLWILEDFRWKRKNHLFFLPILVVVWVNSHPGFAIGFILIGVYFLDELITWLVDHWPLGRLRISDLLHERLGSYLYVIVGMLIAVNLNPAGPAILKYPFETVSIGALRTYIQEWQSPNFHELAVQSFIWLLLFTVGVLGASGKRIALSDFLLFAVSVTLALVAARNIPLFALVAAIISTRYATSIIRKRKKISRKSKPAERQLRVLNLAILLFLGLVVAIRVWTVYGQTEYLPEFSSKAPVDVVEYIKETSPEGRLFNSYNWGGYLIWNLREYPVFVDGRTDLYGDSLLTVWLNTATGEAGWQQTLDDWNINLVLIEPSWPIAKLLPTEGWRLLYEDHLAVLYARPK